MIYKRSSQLFKEANQYLPGGVNSPVRAFSAVGGEPLFIKKAKGAYLYDEDDNHYIDYINSWGPMILGHAYDPVIKAIKDRADDGTSFGAPTTIETEIAKLAVSMVSNIDKIRFVNSGTEACMSAVRLARGYTKRDKIIKFKGCYHGHFDSFLIEAGSGASTFGTPNSPGVTQGTAKDTLLAEYNDIESVKTLVEQNQDEIAGIILEPAAGNMSCIPPKDGFLKDLRKICDQHDMLLIFDEVMTGFRLAQGGAQEYFNVRADIMAFGKVIGGGMPVGAFAARHEIMDYLAPDGPVYQAGTLSGNPLAMAAGYVTLKELNERPEIYKELEGKTDYLAKGIHKALKQENIDHTINHSGSMLSVNFSDTPVNDFKTANQCDQERFKQFFQGMMDQGIYIAPSIFETWFVTHALSYEDLDKTIEAVGKVAKTL